METPNQEKVENIKESNKFLDSLVDPEELIAAKANTEYDFSDFHRGHIRQTVKISDRVSAMFQTLNGEEHEFLQGTMDEMVGKPANLIQVRFANNQLSLVLVTLYVDGVIQNLPNLRYDANANIDRESLATRRKALLSVNPSPLLEDLVKHFSWFEKRAHANYKDSLKNG